MIVERMLLVAGLPQGFVGAVRDCVLYSHALGLGGFYALQRDYHHLARANPANLTLYKGPPARLYGRGEHAWIAAPAALDLALSSFRTGGDGVILLEDLVAYEELRVIEGLAARYGAEVEVSALDSAGTSRVRMRTDGSSGEDGVLARALKHGLPLPRALWHELYHRSLAALSPDSIVSRRHAGPVMVDAEGRVHGRDDDDTDFALLTGKPQMRDEEEN
jgi:hypothetical protein